VKQYFSKKIIGFTSAALLLVAALAWAQASFMEVQGGGLIFRSESPQMRFAGTASFRTLDGTAIANITQTGAITNKRQVVSASTGSTALTAAQSGALVVNLGTATTTEFVLPAAAAGLNYCFVEGGDAAGELLIGVTGTNTVVGKIHGAENATGIATAASTGIKNTAATNVKGDMTCLSALTTTTWYMTSVAGVWATR
jgi:hypothetical protein